MQRRLERIYEVEVAHNVDDFLITDAELVARIEEGTTSRTIDEKLLVVQEDDHLDVALYLDSELVDRLSDDDPNSRLHEGNLIDFLTALEGVSHFLYLTWNAEHRRSVSLLELEMQAEVDKYVSAAFLFGQQASGRVPGGLCRWLFEDPVFDASLDRSSLERYRDANYYARKYCARLEERYLRRSGNVGLMNDLRRFYRLTHHHKIGCIEAAG